MIYLCTAVIVILLTVINTYISLIYGVRLGKAMQKDIPRLPIEPVKEAAKKAFKLIKDRPKKSYLQKRDRRESEPDLFN